MTSDFGQPHDYRALTLPTTVSHLSKPTPTCTSFPSVLQPTPPTCPSSALLPLPGEEKKKKKNPFPSLLLILLLKDARSEISSESEILGGKVEV